jgi:crossover junction endodeoxyribonuclease RuvC
MESPGAADTAVSPEARGSGGLATAGCSGVDEVTPLVLGIDPGLSGGIAALHGSEILCLADLPSIAVTRGKRTRREYLPGELVEIVRSILAQVHGATEVLALVERVHSMPGQGVASSFAFGLGTGLIVGVLATLHVAFEWVEPRAWKRGVGLLQGSDKGASLELAQRLYPTAEIGRKDGRAEALLIARFGLHRFGLARAA